MTMVRTRRGSWGWLAVLVGSLTALVLSAGALLGGSVGLDVRPVAAQLGPSDESAETPAPAASSDVAESDRSAAKPTRKAQRAKPEKVVEPGRPKGLSVPRLDLEIPIVATRLDRSGGMALPDRPDRIGWYAYGPRPGAERGSAVLGGHVDSSRYGIGPLVELRRLRTGDRVVVQTDDGPLTFRVATIELISKRALDLDEVFDRDGRPVLRIITCGGPYRADQGGYRDNVVVTAVRA